MILESPSPKTDMLKIFDCLSLDPIIQDSRKLKRPLIGPNKKLTDDENEWYKEAVDAFVKKEIFVFNPRPDTKIGAQPFCGWRVMLDMTRKWKRIKRRKINLLQIGEMPDFITQFRDKNHRDFWHFLAAFLEVYFPGTEVGILKPSSHFFEENVVRTRQHSLTGKKQYLVSDIKERLPLADEAMCTLALCWDDLYPSEDLNFVLGEANFNQHVAVFCFGRFEPKLVAKTGECRDIEALTGDIIYRLLRVMSHETCHLFGLNHCVYFDCAMNESNSLELALSQPLLCCPFCIRKIQFVLDFGLESYFQSLICISEEIHEQFPSEYWPRAVRHSRQFLSKFVSSGDYRISDQL